MYVQYNYRTFQFFSLFFASFLALESLRDQSMVGDKNV